MLATGSTLQFFPPPGPEWSELPPEDPGSVHEELEEVEFSPTLICPECLYTFPCIQRTHSPSTLSQIRAKYVPTPTESAKIQMLIDEVESELTQYTREIERLGKLTLKLSRQRAELERYQREHLTLLSPVRRLPPETLTGIFEYYCELPISIQRDTIMAPAVNLSHVCSFWRELALSLPTLWSSLRVDVGTGSDITFGRAQLLQHILVHSGSHPLTMDLKIQTRWSRVNPLFMHALVQHSHRWETLSYNPNSQFDFTTPSEAPGGLILSHLKSLTLQYGNCTESQFGQMFKEAKALKHLCLEDVFFDTESDFSAPFVTLVPCGQLTSAKFSRQTVPQVMAVLLNSPKLESMTIDNSYPEPPAGWGTAGNPQSLVHPTVQLNHLTSLTISTTDLEGWFTRLSTPALTSLTISPPWSPHPDPNLEFPQTVFLEFLRRVSSTSTSSDLALGYDTEESICVLEELKFDRVNSLTDLQLLAILELTPSLKMLMVREWSPSFSSPPSIPPSPDSKSYGNTAISNYLIRALTIPQQDCVPAGLASPSSSASQGTGYVHDSTSILVPKLHTIDFVAKPSSINYGLLVDMVASRSQPQMFSTTPGSGLTTGASISPIRNVSVRQGWLPYPVFDEPQGHFSRPLVALEPIMLDFEFADASETNGNTHFVDHPGRGPDPCLLADYEVAYRRAGNRLIDLEDTQAAEEDAEPVGKWIGVVQKIKEKAVRSLWWGGSITTPDFSFVRLVSGIF
ncbi:hypothetical protein D9758_012301 [Tetrapyrgos nigripes]|uniref:F-box domain-containing protein n=1 Tax=Tetrapyrgos nigripes TaxID=182062 RepID=A0A8H5CGP0_9AGAR|nr:hypothetical protein D9758_012301 [Tetrapyrgos nigripes]